MCEWATILQVFGTPQRKVSSQQVQTRKNVYNSYRVISVQGEVWNIRTKVLNLEVLAKVRWFGSIAVFVCVR